MVRKSLSLAALFGALWLSHPASAAIWCPRGETETCGVSGATLIQPSQNMAARPVSNTDHTKPIDATQCENIDFGLSGDENGSGTPASAFTVELHWCPKSVADTADDTNTQRDNSCVAYTSGTLTGSGTIQGAGVPSGYVWGKVGGTFAQDPIIWLKCNGPAK